MEVVVAEVKVVVEVLLLQEHLELVGLEQEQILILLLVKQDLVLLDFMLVVAVLDVSLVQEEQEVLVVAEMVVHIQELHLREHQVTLIQVAEVEVQFLVQAMQELAVAEL